jgi:protein SCO1
MNVMLHSRRRGQTADRMLRRASSLLDGPPELDNSGNPARSCIGSMGHLAPPRSGKPNIFRHCRVEALLRVMLAMACAQWVFDSTAHAGTPVSTLTQEVLEKVRFEQRLGQTVSLELEFRDEQGERIRLGDCVGGKAAILVLGYYRCPMLCNLVLNGLMVSLEEMRLDAGKDFQVIMVSIDPKDSSELASAKKRNYLARYRRPGAAGGWHFLTGEEHAIAQLAREVGYHYAYDPGIKEYAHPSGLVVLTPQGQVSRYFFGISYSTRDLAQSLQQAKDQHIGSPIQQLLLLCFHYNPLTGQYGRIIMVTLRCLGAATVVGILVLAFYARRHGHGLAAIGSAPIQPFTPQPANSPAGDGSVDGQPASEPAIRLARPFIQD